MSRKIKKALVATVTTVILAGLACGGSKPSRFYLIQPASMEPESPAGGNAEEEVVVGMLPLEMPDYMMRAQIATHLDGNRLDYAEYDRWAEPIAGNISRVVIADLDRSVAGTTLVEYPWLPNLDVRYR
ncbi:MAG: ABC-type transport auxiliary lipoprotein family protein, partial [Candidatus Latescibacterota bacterium]